MSYRYRDVVSYIHIRKTLENCVRMLELKEWGSVEKKYRPKKKGGLKKAAFRPKKKWRELEKSYPVAFFGA